MVDWLFAWPLYTLKDFITVLLGQIHFMENVIIQH